MRLLLAGSRDFPDLELVKEYVKRLPLDTEIITIRKDGTNNVARNQAMFQELYLYDNYSRTDGKWKNLTTIDRYNLALQDCDKCTIFWTKDKHDDIEKLVTLVKDSEKLLDLITEESIFE